MESQERSVADLEALLAKCERDKQLFRVQRDRMMDRLRQLGEDPTRLM